MDERESYTFPIDYLKNFSAKMFMHFGIAEAVRSKKGIPFEMS